MSQRRNQSPDLLLGFLLIIGLNGTVLLGLMALGVTVSFAACFTTPRTYPPPQEPTWADPIIMALIYTAHSLGVVQLLYVVPIAFIFKRQQQWEWIKGIIIGAVVTALLNAVFFIR